jgi:hypothetical protein
MCVCIYIYIKKANSGFCGLTDARMARVRLAGQQWFSPHTSCFETWPGLVAKSMGHHVDPLDLAGFSNTTEVPCGSTLAAV